MSYNLTFNLDGGKMPSGYSTTYQIETGESITAVVGGFPIPERIGYTFTGWKLAWPSIGFEYIYDALTYTNNSWAHPTSSTDTDTFNYVADAEMVAQWERLSYALTFDAAGGIMPGGYLESYIVQSDEKFVDVIGGFPVPTKEGYRFKGWRNSSYAADFWTDGWGTQPFTYGKNITLVAEYDKLYTLEFDISEGQVSDSRTNVYKFTAGEKVVDVVGENYLELIRPGYKHKYWYSTSGLNSFSLTPDDWATATLPAKNITMYPQFYAVTTLTFDPGDGTMPEGFPLQWTILQNHELSTQGMSYIPTPELDGHDFVGWFVYQEDLDWNCQLDLTFSNNSNADLTARARYVIHVDTPTPPTPPTEDINEEGEYTNMITINISFPAVLNWRPAVDDKVANICSMFVPNNSYVDTPAYEGTALDSNVEGWGKLNGLKPTDTGTTKLAWYGRAYDLAMKILDIVKENYEEWKKGVKENPESYGENPTFDWGSELQTAWDNADPTSVSFEVPSVDKLYWLQMADAMAKEGFETTVEVV